MVLSIVTVFSFVYNTDVESEVGQHHYHSLEHDRVNDGRSAGDVRFEFIVHEWESGDWRLWRRVQGAFSLSISLIFAGRAELFFPSPNYISHGITLRAFDFDN